MRILHVVPTYIPAWRYGGPIHSVHGLCKALVSRGHQVDVVTTNVDGPTRSAVPLGRPVSIDGVNVHYFASDFMSRLYYSPAMYRFMSQAMGGWDLVHTHSVFLWPTSAAAHLARSRRVPYVLSPRGMLVRELIERRSAVLKKAWIGLFERRNLMQASAVHVTSDAERRQLLALGITPPRIVEVPNGIEVRDDRPRDKPDLPLPIGDFVLYLGRISWKKGLDRLLAAIARAPQVSLVIAGNDDEGQRPGLERLAEDLSISRRVRFVGYVEGEDKRWLLANAIALALPSYNENFGNVVLEAMAAGTPVVVTPQVGLADVVRSTGCGVVVDSAPDKLGEAFSSLGAAPQHRRELGERGRAAARAYSWEAVAARMEHAYSDILSRERA